MNTPTPIERKPTVKLQFAKPAGKPVVRKPAPLDYLQRIARRLRALQQINRVESTQVTKDEVVRAWNASYFLPMLKGKDKLRPEKGCPRVPEREPSEPRGIRLVSKPKKGLRLPRIFAPCKKFESSR